MRRRKPQGKAEALAGVPLFAGCSKGELSRISRIADEFDLTVGKVMIREGDSARQFFILLDGWAEVRRKGRKVITMGPVDFFGEIGLITDRLETATVTTTTPAR